MKTFPASQLIINGDGSAFHLHLKPEFLADKIILVGDQDRVNIVASFFDEGSIECDVQSREFHTITGKYKGKRISCISTGIGTDNCDIVMNEIDSLANIDYNTREEKAFHWVRSSLVRSLSALTACWLSITTATKSLTSALRKHWLTSSDTRRKRLCHT